MAIKWFKKLLKDGEGSIFLLSNEGSVVHRRKVSKRTAFVGCGMFAVLALCLLSFVCGLLYYRSLYNESEDARVKISDYVRERDQIVKKVERMGEVVNRTERFLASSKRSLNMDEGDGLDLETSWNFASDGAGSGITKLNTLLAEAEKVEKISHSLFAHSQDLFYYWAARPRIWPVMGYVTSEFGSWRRWGGGLGWQRHEGLDIASYTGTPIKTVADGTVIFSGYQGGYGKTIKIDHGYGLVTMYAHCSRVNVFEGQRVKSGQLIGAVGSTGRSTGPHLHFEVHVDGIQVNPRRYLPTI